MPSALSHPWIGSPPVRRLMPPAESGRGSRCVRRRKWAARKRGECRPASKPAPRHTIGRTSPLLLIFQCHASAMTPWLNRGAKKTNEPTIPLILQAFGWLNRAALARAADRTSAAAAHDRSFAPNRISKLDVGQPPPRRCQSGSAPVSVRSRRPRARGDSAPIR